MCLQATIQVVDCLNNVNLGAQRCIQITKPFVVAFLAGRCMDNVHWRKAEIDCLDIGPGSYFQESGMGRWTRIYMQVRHD